MLKWPLLVSFLAVLLARVCKSFAYPQLELMRSIAEIGVTLLLGYIVESVWMTTRVERKTQDQREDWLGLTVGLGLCGLIGSVVALLVAEHLAAGHSNLLDRVGLWWSVVSLGFLGILVILHPVIVDRWTQKDHWVKPPGTRFLWPAV